MNAYICNGHTTNRFRASCSLHQRLASESIYSRDTTTLAASNPTMLRYQRVFAALAAAFAVWAGLLSEASPVQLTDPQRESVQIVRRLPCAGSGCVAARRLLGCPSLALQGDAPRAAPGSRMSRCARLCVVACAMCHWRWMWCSRHT